ncbi:MAG: di-trans,poly-cis-decaprenylcistransferase [Kiritimatiellae bacterium]|nr:di-trans,poly-cis-decaprenylcistransferase [Kiritimatiellia bacterium]
MEHLAIIMDGNGRWAKAHHKPRLSGHRAGAEALDRVMHYCRDAGIKYITVYAFSTENWKRSKAEVSGLMKLLSSFIKNKEKELVANGVRFRVVGRKADLSPKLQKEIAGLEERTKGGSFTLAVALSYGGRAEIIDAANEWRRANPKDDLTEESFRAFLYAPDIPDPDLIVRTSGEVRTSNFLLWESAYSEYYFTDVLWPDFDRAEFDKALASYGKRERRMGGRLKK